MQGSCLILSLTKSPLPGAERPRLTRRHPFPPLLHANSQLRYESYGIFLGIIRDKLVVDLEYEYRTSLLGSDDPSDGVQVLGSLEK